jgi:hypothetical protein
MVLGENFLGRVVRRSNANLMPGPLNVKDLLRRSINA